MRFSKTAYLSDSMLSLRALMPSSVKRSLAAISYLANSFASSIVIKGYFGGETPRFTNEDFIACFTLSFDFDFCFCFSGLLWKYIAGGQYG